MSAFANDDNDTLSYGIYEALLDEGLRGALLRHPELRSVLSKIDPEEQPSRYAAFDFRRWHCNALMLYWLHCCAMSLTCHV